MKDLLNPEKALIFRIVHRENVRAVLENGLRCRNSRRAAGPYVAIGDPDLIWKREHRVIPIAPHGTLSDYIPFYFTPFSPMAYNIKTGYRGITQRPNADTAIFVTSLHRLAEHEIPFIFSDRHAYLRAAQFSTDLDDLPDFIDWDILQRRDFRYDGEDPEKTERYQAEALVHRRLPMSALSGVVGATQGTVDEIAN